VSNKLFILVQGSSLHDCVILEFDIANCRAFELY